MGLRQAHHVTKGQCTPTIIQKLECDSDYQEIDNEQDAIGMLKMINNISFKFEDLKVFTFKNVTNALRGMMNVSKKPEEDLMKCRDRLNNKVASFEQFGDMSNTEAITNADLCTKVKQEKTKKNNHASKEVKLQEALKNQQMKQETSF